MVLGGHQLHSLIHVAQFMACNPFGSLSATRWIIMSFLSKPFQFLAILTKACFILLQGNHLSFCTPFHWRTWWLSGLFSSSRVSFQAQVKKFCLLGRGDMDNEKVRGLKYFPKKHLRTKVSCTIISYITNTNNVSWTKGIPFPFFQGSNLDQVLLFFWRNSRFSCSKNDSIYKTWTG